jgi:predicted AAA+ superfamily ATPase
MKMCAARSGQILNLSALGDDCGITHNTAKAWLSVLQVGFIIFLLQPHHKNFNKRLIKSPKLYFYDSGLLCYLLGLSSPDSLAMHPFRGHIFETWVISELLKGRFNRGLRENLYFWRDHVGHEVDCIIEHGETLIPLEIKSGETVTIDFFKGLNYWYQISGISPRGGYIIYGGEGDQRRKESSVMRWKSFASKVPLEI